MLTRRSTQPMASPALPRIVGTSSLKVNEHGPPVQIPPRWHSLAIGRRYPESVTEPALLAMTGVKTGGVQT